MLASTQRLEKTSERLQYGRQQLLETEVRGALTMHWAGHVVGSARCLHARLPVALRSRAGGRGGQSRQQLLQPGQQAGGEGPWSAGWLLVPPPRHTQVAGQSILEEMQRQREALQRSKQSIQQAQQQAEQSNSLLSAMARRAKWFFG